jgi:hypothetical protein
MFVLVSPIVVVPRTRAERLIEITWGNIDATDTEAVGRSLGPAAPMARTLNQYCVPLTRPVAVQFDALRRAGVAFINTPLQRRCKWVDGTIEPLQRFLALWKNR